MPLRHYIQISDLFGCFFDFDEFVIATGSNDVGNHLAATFEVAEQAGIVWLLFDPRPP